MTRFQEFFSKHEKIFLKMFALLLLSRLPSYMVTFVTNTFCPRSCQMHIFCTYQNKGVVTNYGEGGATKREGGGHGKFYPYEKGGRKKF